MTPSKIFQVKICGITSLGDAHAAMSAGADMIGLNFYAESVRYVTPEVAQGIAANFSQTTGVFVNSSAAEINRIAEVVGLEWVQLHGDEPPALLADLQEDLPIIRVRTLAEGGWAAIVDDWEACCASGREPAAMLVDATVAGQYGGTGKTADWTAVADYRRWLAEVPLILAGGLNAGNVAEAISIVQPHAVDTASGVELAPGVKSPQQMRFYAEAALAAFAKKSG